MYTDPDVERVLLFFQTMALVVSLVTLYVLVRWTKTYLELVFKLPAMVYCAHAAVYYGVLLASRSIHIEIFDSVAMAWSVALRLHAAIMLFNYARWWIKCRQN